MIECPVCGGDGCQHCDGGRFQLDRCPRQIIGSELTEAINLAGMCGGGDWPVKGGLLDQSAWFISLKQMLESETNTIKNADHKE